MEEAKIVNYGLMTSDEEYKVDVVVDGNATSNAIYNEAGSEIDMSWGFATWVIFILFSSILSAFCNDLFE